MSLPAAEIRRVVQVLLTGRRASSDPRIQTASAEGLGQLDRVLAKENGPLETWAPQWLHS